MNQTGDKLIGTLSPNRYKQIPIGLISECKKISSDMDKIMFIFDVADKESIERNQIISKEELRDNLISKVLDTNDNEYFYIGDEFEFDGLPSRLSYYDTVTDTINQGLRKQRIFDFLYYIGLIHDDSHEERNVFWDSGIKSDTPRVFIEVKDNFMIFVRVLKTNDESSSNMTYNFFFNKSKILDIVSKVFPKEMYRNIRINELLKN